MKLEDKRLLMKEAVIKYREYILKRLHEIIQYSFRGNYEDLSIEFVEAEVYTFFDKKLKYYDPEKSKIMHYFNQFVIPSFKEHLYDILNKGDKEYETSLEAITESIDAKNGGNGSADISMIMDKYFKSEKYKAHEGIDIENTYEFVINSKVLDMEQKNLIIDYYGFNKDKKVLKQLALEDNVSISTIYDRIQRIQTKLKKEIIKNYPTEVLWKN